MPEEQRPHCDESSHAARQRELSGKWSDQKELDELRIPGFPSNFEILWEDPDCGRLVKRLSAFSRLILFQPRGSWLRDGVDPRALPDPRARVEDIIAVMDAAGCGQAALFGASDGVAQALSFAATHPERMRALVLAGGYACFADTATDAKRLRATWRSWGLFLRLPCFGHGGTLYPKHRSCLLNLLSGAKARSAIFLSQYRSEPFDVLFARQATNHDR